MGVTYDAKVSSIRILGNVTSWATHALSYNYQQNHIYSCSWDLVGLATKLYPVANVVLRALEDATVNGRGGLGSIYVFAAGHGEGQSCAFKGYANAIQTITVGAHNENEYRPQYSEACTSLLVAAPSGKHPNGSIATTTVNGKCNARFSGTSASAPMVAGAIALVLQAR